MKVSTGFQSSEGGRFYEIELDSGDGFASIGDTFGSMSPFNQARVLGVLGDMMACTYAKTNHIMVADYEARMSELKVQLRALIEVGKRS